MIGIAFNDCRGWYHPAPGSRAVLLCSPQGFEDLCARHSWLALAQALSDAGMPVLRFDYPGTADALGSDEDAGLVARWRESIRHAAAWLERQTGAEEIVIVGLRLGGLLAALEVAAIPRAKALVLMAPVASGRFYTREMSMLARVMQPVIPGEDEPAPAADAIDVCGFRISRETERALKPLTIADSAVSGIPVLLMAQNGVDLADLKQQYEARGCRADLAPFPGYDEMICDPTAARVPHAAIASLLSWIAALDPPLGLGVPLPRSGCATPAVARLSPPKSAEIEGRDWTEAPVAIAGGAIAGILCAPARPVANAPPVIFLNPGMSYHIGWSRMHVRLARALAADGIASLRYDTPGIGDSADDPAAGGQPLYDAIAERGLVAAIDALESLGYMAPLVVGTCSGAYTALHVTRRDPRIGRAIIVNLQCFVWTPAMGFLVERWRKMRRNEVAAKRSASDPDQGLVRAVVSRCRSSAFDIARRLVRLGRRLRASVRAPALPDDSGVVGWFQALAERGVPVTLVYSEQDPGLAVLEAHAGPGGQEIMQLPGISLAVIARADHPLTPRWAQDDLLAIVREAALAGAKAPVMERTAA